MTEHKVAPVRMSMIYAQAHYDLQVPEVRAQASFDAESTAWAQADRRGYCNGFEVREQERRVYVAAFLSIYGETP